MNFEGHALHVLKNRKKVLEGMLQDIEARSSLLWAELEQQRLVKDEKTTKLDDVNAAIEKLERA